MSSLLVVIELAGERVHPASLEALGQARRLATTLGATVYAAAPCEKAPGYGEEDLIAVLSRHGADKVLLAAAPRHAGGLRWGAHGGAIVAACQLVHPLLVMLAETPGARDVAGRLASRLGAACLMDAFVEVGEGDTLFLGERVGASMRLLDAELDFPVVTVLAPGRYEGAAGDEEAEVEMLDPPAPERDFEPVAGETSMGPGAVVLGEGAEAEALARALGGVVAKADGALVLRGTLAVSVGDVAAHDLEGAGTLRVALGRDPARTVAAHFALDGDAASLARGLARAVSATESLADAGTLTSASSGGSASSLSGSATGSAPASSEEGRRR